MKFNIDEINKLIATRRSFKPALMSDQEIDATIIANILDNAKWAPTHGMTEPWHFVIFSQNGRKQLSDFQCELYKSETETDKFRQLKYEKLLNNPLSVSHVIAICLKRQEIEKIPEIEEIEAIACAVQNMHLTATAYGLGAFWSTGFVAYHDKMKVFLQLTEKDKCLGFLYLGYPKDTWLEGNRQAIETKTRWVTD